MADKQLHRQLYLNECRRDQVRAVFGSVRYGVIAASIAAMMLAYYLVIMHLADMTIEIGWFAYICLCASCHIVLNLFSTDPALNFERGCWRTHAFLFICLAEGLGWGASPLLVYHSVDGTGELFTLLDIAGLAAGAVVAFGPYLPAFACFFIAAVAPMAIILTLSPITNLHTAGLFGDVCFFGIGGLGIIFNNNFRKNLILKIESEQSARELRLQKEFVEKANVSKSQFLAAASHDLRQPIHAIGLYIGALRQIDTISDANMIIDKIEASLADMDALFSGILDISRLDASVVKVKKVSFSIDKLIDRVCSDHKLEATAIGLDLRSVKCGKDIESDPIIIERILRNLISNALRYTQTGRVLVGVRRWGSHLRIEVWDTGCGIAPEHQEKIFEEFYQVQNLERDRSKGLGLGLAIVRRLTKIIDGNLTLRSQAGKGSCFSFSVPIAQADASEEEENPNFNFQKLGRGLIAIVDDELAVLDAMSSLLQRWGYTVLAAECGDEMIHLLSVTDKIPDLIICDYRLRGEETGQDVIGRVRFRFRREVPAMLITGDTAPERIAEAQSGDALVLHKPVPNGKLRAAIISLLVRPAPAGEPKARQDA